MTDVSNPQGEMKSLLKNSVAALRAVLPKTK